MYLCWLHCAVFRLRRARVVRAGAPSRIGVAQNRLPAQNQSTKSIIDSVTEMALHHEHSCSLDSMYQVSLFTSRARPRATVNPSGIRRGGAEPESGKTSI